jgi:hypothetical protein
MAIGIDHEVDREAEPSQRRADAVGIVAGIGERRRVEVFGNADDQRDPAALRPCNVLEHQEKCDNGNNRSDQDDHRNPLRAQSRGSLMAPQPHAVPCG